MVTESVMEMEEDTQADKFLTFVMGDESYALEMRNITEIIGMQKITPVPDMPESVRGVINLRGQVIPVMDVRLRFGMPQRAYDDRTCIVVINVDGTVVGLVVDTVSEVLVIPENQIEAAPKMGGPNRSGVIKGIGKVGESVKILLDAAKLLRDEELLSVSELSGTEVAA